MMYVSMGDGGNVFPANPTDPFEGGQNPGTPLGALKPVLSEVDLVLVMSVNPGYGGQSYIPASTGRIARLRQMLDDIGSDAWLEVDGGIYPGNAAEIVTAGASALVAGSAIFGGPKSIAENIAAFQAALAGR